MVAGHSVLYAIFFALAQAPPEPPVEHLEAVVTDPQSSPGDPQAVMTAIFADLGVTDYRFRKTKSFIIGYNTSEDFLRPHLGRLEGIYSAVSRFCEVNGFTGGELGSGAMVSPLVAQEEAGAKSPLLAKEGVRGRSAEDAELLPIIFFDRYHTFARYAETLGMPSEGIAGFYHQSNNVAAFVNALDLPSIVAVSHQLQALHADLSQARATATDDAGRAVARQIENTIYSLAAQRDSLVEAFNRFVLQHEAAHQILFNAGVHARGAASPQWLVEGLACQFEVPQADRSGRLQRVNQMRLADLRQAMGLPRGANTDARVNAAILVSDGRLVPLKQLVSGKEVFDGGNPRLTLAYAQSWSLVLYLYRTSPDAFREYLHKLSKREPGTEPNPDADLAEFETAFGPINALFEQKWADFMTRLQFDL